MVTQSYSQEGHLLILFNYLSQTFFLAQRKIAVDTRSLVCLARTMGGNSSVKLDRVRFFDNRLARE